MARIHPLSPLDRWIGVWMCRLRAAGRNVGLSTPKLNDVAWILLLLLSVRWRAAGLGFVGGTQRGGLLATAQQPSEAADGESIECAQRGWGGSGLIYWLV